MSPETKVHAAALAGRERKRRGRPRLPQGRARVVLAAQRIKPETLAALRRLAPAHGGVGRVIDAAVARLPTAPTSHE